MYNRNGGGRGGGSAKVCDFFLQGRCKFGDNCKFEHPGAQSGSTGNRFAPLSGQGGNGGSARGRPGNSKDPLPYHLNKENIIADLKDERPQWPFSAYGPGRDAPRQLFGGFPIEQSPEEMRALYYAAQASGNPQTAVQGEQDLFQRMNQQIEKVLGDPDGAVQYILDGDNEHPNRRDEISAPGQASAIGSGNPFSQPPSQSAFGRPSTVGNTPATTGAFGAPAFGSASTPFGGVAASSGTFGQPTQPTTASTFGQPSQFGTKPAFGQSSQPTGGPAFGQPAQLGGSAFGQPSQMGAPPAFGQPSQTGASSAFGQPSQPGASSAFGQPSAFGQASQLGGGSAFGKPSSLGASNAFGQASGLGQPKPAFGQPSAAGNPFSNPQSSSGFGQPSQIGQASPFAAAAQQQQQQTATGAGSGLWPQQQNAQGGNTSGFAGGSASMAVDLVAQQPAQGPTQANTSAIKSPFAVGHTHPPPQAGPAVAGGVAGSTNDTPTPPISSYAQHRNGQLNSWRGAPVTQKEGIPYFSKTGNIRDASSLERIWFPDGPPAGNPYTAESEELFAKAGSEVESAYRSCAEQGAFNGMVPLLAPIRAWTRFDL